MAETLYTDRRLVALYDTLNAWGPSDDFYLALPEAAKQRILDAGCGTGLLAAAFAAEGHEVVGIDPAQPMLDLAAQRRGGDGVTWRRATLQGFASERPFDLICMTGHAFQCLLTDEVILAAFQNANKLLGGAGRFVFETRNPSGKPWEQWRRDTSFRRGTTPAGEAFEMFHQLLQVADQRVTFETCYRLPATEDEFRSTSTLRFCTYSQLEALTQAAGLKIENTWGDWDQSDLSAASPEIILSLVPA